MRSIILAILLLTGASLGYAGDYISIAPLTAERTASTIPDIVMYRCHSVAKIIARTGGAYSNTGSGSYLGDGLWLTNAHVVKEGVAFEVQLKTGKRYLANLIRFEHDQDPDLALLQTVDIPGLPAIPIRSEENGYSGPKIGDIVYPTGFDFGHLDRHHVWPARVTRTHSNGDYVAVGVDSRKGSISGNSGGPVIDSEGYLVSPLWGNNSIQGAKNGSGSTIAVCWRRTRLFLLPWRSKIVEAIRDRCGPGGCPPPNYPGGEPPMPIPTEPPSYIPPEPPSEPQPSEPECKIDYSILADSLIAKLNYDKLADLVVEKIDGDERFRGPAGPQGPKGDPGPKGERGPNISSEQIAAITESIIEVIASDPEFRGPPGKDADIDVEALKAEVLAAIPPRRVLLIDGKSKEILDDETYSINEPIVLDLQNVTKQIQQAIYARSQ